MTFARNFIVSFVFFRCVLSFCDAQSPTCATMTLDSMQRVMHPELGTLQKFEQWLQEKIGANKQAGVAKTEASYILPVVVHVIHNGEAVGVGTNSSDAQIQSQIDVLNEDYNKANAGISSLTEPPFDQTNWSALAADCQLTFCLAKYDTVGNFMPSAGIDRVDRNINFFSSPPYNKTYINDVIKPTTIWNPNKYLNIWVLDLGSLSSTVAFATLPVNSTLDGVVAPFGTATTDGVVVSYKAFGRVGMATFPYTTGRITTHEIGHWLGLRHIWGDGPCATDYCDDTPIQLAPNIGIPTFPHISCNNEPYGDMFINYMDYSIGSDLIMFTNDQKIRMHTVIANCPFRVNLANQGSNCGYASMDEQEEAKINIYPNPASGELKVFIPVGINTRSLEVLNVLGQQEHDVIKEISPYYFVLDFSQKRNTVFFIKISTEKTTILKRVLIIQ